VWGLTYVDELIQVGNIDWYGEGIQSRHWAATDANYNVLGVIDYWGTLVERYEYTPYGQRQVYRSAGSIVSDDYVSSEIGYQTRYFSGANDPGLHAPTDLGRRAFGFDLGRMPIGLCEVGHQGLFHDEHVGLVYNRARHLHPTLGRFVQRDPAGYVDGGSLFLYLKANPLGYADPFGRQSTSRPASEPRENRKACYEEPIEWTVRDKPEYDPKADTDIWGSAAGIRWSATVWKTTFREDKLDCPRGCRKLVAHCYFGGTAWYVKGGNWKAHEMRHAKIAKSAYNNAKRNARKIESFGCMPAEAADCYVELQNMITRVNRRWQDYQNSKFHCDGGVQGETKGRVKTKACGLMAADKKAYEEARRPVDKKDEECRKLRKASA
jgi:RHS repeat-associated protein